MKLQLEAMGLAVPAVEGHPNRLPFRGVLTLVGSASDRSPSGAQGHRVLLGLKAAEAALPSLLGMALDYSPAMDAHDTQRKIGIITDATIEPLRAGRAGNQVAIAGFLYAHDFPGVVREIQAGSGELGMSYEIANAWVPDTSSAVWTVTKFTFTGAAVLRRDKAAYPQTWIRIDEAIEPPVTKRVAAAITATPPAWARKIGAPCRAVTA